MSQQSVAGKGAYEIDQSRIIIDAQFHRRSMSSHLELPFHRSCNQSRRQGSAASPPIRRCTAAARIRPLASPSTCVMENASRTGLESFHQNGTERTHCPAPDLPASIYSSSPVLTGTNEPLGHGQQHRDPKSPLIGRIKSRTD